MRRHLFWRTTEVGSLNGKVYGSRVREAMECSGVHVGDTECQDMKGLATGLKILAEVRECKRIMVAVGVESVERGGSRFADEVMRLPRSLRGRLTIELHGLRDEVSAGCAEFAERLQGDGLVSFAAWVRCGETEFVEDVVRIMSPTILAIEREDCRKAMQAGHRTDFIDTLEIASSGGSMVMADGVDCEKDFRAMQELGVELMHGRFWGKTRFAEEAVQVSGVLPVSFNRRRQESGKGEYVGSTGV